MSKKDSITGTLELQGEGQVKVKPDIATVRLSVITEDKTADGAAGANAQRASEVVERMLRLGIPRDSMTTTGLSVYPIYQTDPGTNVTSVVGYRAQDAIAVEAPISLAGKVFDTGIAAGANESSGMSFSVKDERPYREQALELAIKAARSEAAAVAKAMGVSLIGPRTIQVSQGSGPISTQPDRAFSKAMTPVLPGEQTIPASVRVVFEYRT